MRWVATNDEDEEDHYGYYDDGGDGDDGDYDDDDDDDVLRGHPVIMSWVATFQTPPLTLIDGQKYSIVSVLNIVAYWRSPVACNNIHEIVGYMRRA